MFGNVVICTQNLAISGANQVLLNLVEGEFCKLGEIVVISPVDGPFAQFFMKADCSVRIGGQEVLTSLRTIRLAVCNTVMTAHLILAFHKRGIPQLWILHEWWPRSMLMDELNKRNLSYLTQATVDEALTVCSRVICVCEAQKEVYSIKAQCEAIYVGVPEPTMTAIQYRQAGKRPDGKVRFLTLGIVCPRKNQQMAVRAFRKFAGDRTDVELDIVGARYIRDYEKEYVAKVEEEIGNDTRIKLHPVTDDPASWYARADVLLFLSVNEVTPLVIAEAGLHGLPSITYDIGGIKEMVIPSAGMLLEEGDLDGAVEACRVLADDHAKRASMGTVCMKHFKQFTIPHMVRRYETVSNELSPTVVLLDMDGVLVDWDKGFYQAWERFGHDPSKIDRTKSYCMEDCVPDGLRDAAIAVMSQPGFFRDLPPMPGAVEAVTDMIAEGFAVFICTAPLPSNPTCCQDKIDWVLENLGPAGLDIMSMVMTRDKCLVQGDVLIDDKPVITGSLIPTWEHILFAAPYNTQTPEDSRLRIDTWQEWRRVLASRLSPNNPLRASLLTKNASLQSMQSIPSRENICIDSGSPSSARQRASSDLRLYPAASCGMTANSVRMLRDFSSEIPNLASARQDYLRWRSGGSKGMKGNVDSGERLQMMMQKLEDAAERQAVLECEDAPEDILLVRKQYRKQYSKWRSGNASGVSAGVAKQAGGVEGKRGANFSPDSRLPKNFVS
jgi:5'-nucleotidase